MRPQHKKFADHYIKHGDIIAAYSKAYPGANVTTARVSGYRLLQNVTVTKYIQEKSQKIEALATTKAVEELKDRIVADVLTREEKRAILAAIVRGELSVPSKKPVFNPISKKFEIVTVNEEPDHITRLKAIDLDNKMSGDNAPEKIAPTDVDGNNLHEVFDPMRPTGKISYRIADAPNVINI